MKKIAAIILFFLLFTLSAAEGFPSTAHANGAGLPAFFSINGKLANSNPLQTFGITASSFLIPQDLAQENYVVDKPIDFSIDETPLEQVIPKQLLKNTKFTWEYGDGTKAEGLQNTHVYTKTGSYILILTIDVYTDDSSAPTKFIDSFLLNIVPQTGYKQIPQAVITVNDQQIIESYLLENIDFTQPIKFDATKSKSSGKIVQYIWNFGDGQTSTQPVATHTYAQDTNFVTAVLRVKDSSGFISDAFVGIGDTNAAKTKSVKKNALPNFFWITPLILFGLLIAIIILWQAAKKK